MGYTLAPLATFTHNDDKYEYKIDVETDMVLECKNDSYFRNEVTAEQFYQNYTEAVNGGEKEGYVIIEPLTEEDEKYITEILLPFNNKNNNSSEEYENNR